MMLDRTFGFVLALSAVALWAIFSNVAKHLFLEGFSAADLTIIRIVIAAGVLWLGGYINRTWMFPPLSSLTNGQPRSAGFLLAIFGFSLWAMMFTFYEAVYHLGVALGVIIQFTHPLLIILFGVVILGERISALALLSMASIMVGVTLVVQLFETGHMQMSWIGVAWGLASAVANAAYLLLGRYVQDKYQAGPSLLWGFTVAAVLAITWAELHDGMNLSSLLNSTVNVLACLGIGIFGTLGAFALMLVATRYISPLEVGLTSSLEAVFAGLLAAWWFGENLSGLQLIGSVLIIGGVSLTCLRGVQAKSVPITNDV